MLTLTRKPGEYLMIGENVRVYVTAVSGTKVRLTVDAPRDMRIDRSEVRESKDSGRGAA